MMLSLYHFDILFKNCSDSAVFYLHFITLLRTDELRWFLYIKFRYMWFFCSQRFWKYFALRSFYLIFLPDRTWSFYLFTWSFYLIFLPDRTWSFYLIVPDLFTWSFYLIVPDSLFQKGSMHTNLDIYVLFIHSETVTCINIVFLVLNIAEKLLAGR